MRWRSGIVLAVLATVMALCSGHGRAAVPRSFALVVGISSYDPATALAELPQCETSARALHAVLDSQAEARLLVRRVTRQNLLDSIRSVGQACGRDDLFLLFVVGAGDDGGLIASDGRVTPQQLKDAIEASPARHRAICIDAAGGAVLASRIGSSETAVLASTREAQAAWSAFFPFEDGVRLESGAAHGWCRALERAGESWRGDLGNKGSLDIEDLRMCGDLDAEEGLPDPSTHDASREGRRVLDEALGMPALRAIRPTAARRLEHGGDVTIDDLRKDLGDIRFEQLAGVLQALSGDDISRTDDATRKQLLDSLRNRGPMEALQALHNALLRANLLDTPAALETRSWKRLVKSGAASVALVLPVTQRASLQGRADLAVFGGSAHHVRFRVPYGRYTGDVSGKVHARLRLEVLGPYLSGHWEGERDGKWLEGDWQGTYDARDGKLTGRVSSRLQAEDVTHDAPKSTVWPLTFEGKVTEEGTVLSGTWRAMPDLRTLPPPPPLEGNWRVRK